MTNVVYVGPYEEGVDLVLPSGASKRCNKGEPVDVPQALVESLVEQSIWEVADKASTPAPTPTSTSVPVTPSASPAPTKEKE